MAIYSNKRQDSIITGIEFAPVADGNFTFFYTRPRDNKDEFKQWMAGIGQEVIAETIVDGQTVFVTHGDKTQEDMMKALGARGENLELKQPDRKFEPWKWRGILSMTGHPMQLAASMMGPKGFNFGVGLFAILNLAANLTNITFGAERRPDPHRLRHIKAEINDDFGEFINVDDLVSVDDQRAAIRKEPEEPKSAGQKFHSFMRRNSVTLGEIGLRYLGGVSLVFPIDQWKNSAKVFSETGSFKKLFETARNKDKFIAVAGAWWLAGKTIAFFSKVPDPYNPEPPSALDTIREKYLFRISTLTEMAGAGTLAWHRYNAGKIKWPDKGFVPAALRGRQTTDYLGSVGGMLFMAAFGMRLMAPYGVKEVNMEEVYAHAGDTLAKTSPDKLPQLMADTAATLKEHFKDKDGSYGEIFSQMMVDLYRYHHIALDNFDAGAKAQQAAVHGHTPELKKQAATPHSSALDRVSVPAATHAEEVRKTASSRLQLGT